MVYVYVSTGSVVPIDDLKGLLYCLQGWCCVDVQMSLNEDQMSPNEDHRNIEFETNTVLTSLYLNVLSDRAKFQAHYRIQRADIRT